MELNSLLGVFPALIAALAAYAAGRSSNKVARLNAQDNNRIEMEKEAYDRARRFDIETITRQDTEMEELRAAVQSAKQESSEALIENRHLRQQNLKLERKVQTLVNRVSRLETALPHDHPLKPKENT